jgi:hypothetical protein
MQKKIKNLRVTYFENFINLANIRITKRIKFGIEKKNKRVLITCRRPIKRFEQIKSEQLKIG